MHGQITLPTDLRETDKNWRLMLIEQICETNLDELYEYYVLVAFCTFCDISILQSFVYISTYHKHISCQWFISVSLSHGKHIKLHRTSPSLAPEPNLFFRSLTRLPLTNIIGQGNSHYHRWHVHRLQGWIVPKQSHIKCLFRTSYYLQDTGRHLDRCRRCSHWCHQMNAPQPHGTAKIKPCKSQAFHVINCGSG